ncbi:polysaccharide transporter [Salinigranum marinum]|uniref:polysaccharide transporter n=1 Tax=Salinigranum marinum TaxID=1515595 RepID=UPI002989EDF2|nr:polysaccharide transporter [Salinigranum marinum]
MILPTQALLVLLGRRRRALEETDVSLEGDEWGRYRKRPVVIDAKQLTQRVEIDTREGTVVGEAGDYLIVGVEGEIYPCGREIFEKTYEEV